LLGRRGGEGPTGPGPRVSLRVSETPGGLWTTLSWCLSTTFSPPHSIYLSLCVSIAISSSRAPVPSLSPCASHTSISSVSLISRQCVYVCPHSNRIRLTT
jgi:hypothetical protein